MNVVASADDGTQQEWGCVGVRCYDVKLAQDMKAHNSLTAIAMYDDLIRKLTPCLIASNISIQQLIAEKADIYSKLKKMLVCRRALL
ncbi:hypothetical protein B566_EDAN018522 [Ephemera danica]|nr:hypothetical protein B566_EDAN018522 [Ephemera danica]